MVTCAIAGEWQMLTQTTTHYNDYKKTITMTKKKTGNKYIPQNGKREGKKHLLWRLLFYL